MYETWGTDQRTGGMISHSKDGMIMKMKMSKCLLAAYKLAAHTNKLQHKCCVKLRYPTHKRQRVQRQTNAHVIYCELQEQCAEMSRTELTGQLAKWNFLKHLNANKTILCCMKHNIPQN